MNEVEMGWFEKQLEIDKHGLDDALTKQPELYFHVGERASFYSSKADEAKEMVKQTYAQVSNDLRLEYAEKGERTTEKQLEAEILLARNYVDAQRNYLAAKLESDKWQVLKESFAQRSYVLKDLAGLYVANYFSTDAVKGLNQSQVQRDGYEDRRKRLAEKRAAAPKISRRRLKG